jgi:hypothetical protein
LRYFETQRDAWRFLTNCDRAEIDKTPHSGGQPKSSGSGNKAARWVFPDDRLPPHEHDAIDAGKPTRWRSNFTIGASTTTGRDV